MIKRIKNWFSKRENKWAVIYFLPIFILIYGGLLTLGACIGVIKPILIGAIIGTCIGVGMYLWCNYCTNKAFPNDDKQ